MTAKNISELYPCKWLKADDLPKNGKVATIESTEVQTFRRPTGKEEPALVIFFVNATKALIANKTQLRAIEAVAGSEVFEDWTGVKVHLEPGTAPNQKPTIVISKPTK